MTTFTRGDQVRRKQDGRQFTVQAELHGALMLFDTDGLADVADFELVTIHSASDVIRQLMVPVQEAADDEAWSGGGLHGSGPGQTLLTMKRVLEAVEAWEAESAV